VTTSNLQRALIPPSLHTLTGIHPRSERPMQIYVFINGTTLRALLDSGSTHNFVDSEAASRAGIVFVAQHSLRVAVANGDRVESSRCCRNLKISIADEDFVIDSYGLALGSYEMVLGVQWLASLGPILWDFGKQSMLFIQNGRVVKWAASSLPSQPDPSVAFAIADDLEELLQHFSTLLRSPWACHQSAIAATRSGCCRVRCPLPFARTDTRTIRNKNWSASVLLSGTLPIAVLSLVYTLVCIF
jgi:hypothetical protein